MQLKLSALIVGVALFQVNLATVAAVAEPSNSEKVVADGMIISLEYTLIGEDGKIIESNRGKEPVKYVQGEKSGMPTALEKEMIGMKVGQEKQVRLENAFGPINPRAFQEIPKSQIPASELKQIKVGSMIPLTAPNGEAIGAPVSEIRDKAIVVNLNHPMAGKTLVFYVKVLDIQPPPAAQPTKPPSPTQPK